MNEQPPKKYDVALSFASEDRTYVKTVAIYLQKKGVKVFIDEDKQIELWGKDMITYFDEVFQFDARYCVMFLSIHYANKRWTNHERKNAQARAFYQNEEYILPYRFDQTTIPGIRPTISYLENMTAMELGEAIIAKLNNKNTIPSAASSFNKTLARYKEWLNESDHSDVLTRLIAKLKISPKDPLLNLFYCLFLIRQKELTTNSIHSTQIEEIEKRLSLSLKEVKLRSTILIIQAFIKHDFHESRGWITQPSSKAIFQNLLKKKDIPDKELLKHLKLSNQFSYKLKPILAWLK